MIKWIRKYWKTFCAGFLFSWVFLSMIQIARIECKLVELEKKYIELENLVKSNKCVELEKKYDDLEKKYDAFAGVVKEFDDWQVTVNEALKMFD